MDAKTYYEYIATLYKSSLNNLEESQFEVQPSPMGGLLNHVEGQRKEITNSMMLLSPNNSHVPIPPSVVSAPPLRPPIPPKSAESAAPMNSGEVNIIQYEKMPLKQKQHAEYPRVICNKIILGPKGSEIDMMSYKSITWESPAAATRQLLDSLFSSDILATHSLTGKPSKNNRNGNNRQTKMQLDPKKIDDIIYCVSSKFKCANRVVRAAITKKCVLHHRRYICQQKKKSNIIR